VPQSTTTAAEAAKEKQNLAVQLQKQFLYCVALRVSLLPLIPSERKQNETKQQQGERGNLRIYIK
jgi:hypothetical protein